jgi:hypothetical protein
MTVSAQDKFGNSTEDEIIGLIDVVPRGKIVLDSAHGGTFVSDAQVAVLVFNPDDNTYSRWDGESYEVANPVYSDVSGEYTMLLPVGKYELIIQKDGYQRVRSSTFDIDRPQYVTFNFEMSPREGIRGFIENLLENIVQ